MGFLVSAGVRRGLNADMSDRFQATGNFHLHAKFRGSDGRHELDDFQRLESLLDSAGIEDVKAASALTRGLKGRSEPVRLAVDEFMLDFLTLVFVIESGENAFEQPVREMARTRLSDLRQLMSVAA